MGSGYNSLVVSYYTLQVTELLPVPSNETNLYSLALAVSSGSPILLQGVVGSGKTSLVEHLAKLTGRSGPPQLMKIQLGDQMDSKVLYLWHFHHDQKIGFTAMV